MPCLALLLNIHHHDHIQMDVVSLFFLCVAEAYVMRMWHDRQKRMNEATIAAFAMDVIC